MFSEVYSDITLGNLNEASKMSDGNLHGLFNFLLIERHTQCIGNLSRQPTIAMYLDLDTRFNY
jgi:hypothetical protein